MLPRIARLKSGLSGRSRWSLLVCGLAFLALPTWSQQARSQFGGGASAEKKPDEKPATTNSAKNQGGAANSHANIPAAAVRRSSLPPMAPPSVEFLPEPIGVEKKVLELLEQQVEFNFTDESLAGIVEYLAETHGLQVVLDKVKLEEESIAIDAKNFSLKLSGISLRSALKILLQEKNLTYLFEDEVIKVSTRTDAFLKRPTRTYPVRDLVGNVDVDYQLLSKAIQQSIGGQPDAPWADTDGEGGSISILPETGCLVIRQTSEVHEEILKLLRALRKANAEMQVK